MKSILPNAAVIHCTRETPNDWEFFMSIVEASKTRDIIADRFCYGQFVYQNEDERHLTTDELLYLEAEMIAHGAKVIHVTAPVDEIEDRLTFRGEKTSLPVREICDRYLNLFENLTLIKPYLWWTGRYD